MANVEHDQEQENVTRNTNKTRVYHKKVTLNGNPTLGGALDVVKRSSLKYPSATLFKVNIN